MRTLFFLSLLMMLPAQNDAKLKKVWKEIPSFDSAIQKPDQFFGFTIGTRHLTTMDVMRYLNYLAGKTDRLVLEEMGKGHSGVKTWLATFTKKENRSKIVTLKADRKAFMASDRGDFPKSDLMVVWMGYSIHGNEASGFNAVPLVAYALAAGQGPWMDKLLRESVVLVDPFLNPDGINRFAHFVNTFRGQVANPDGNHIEHREFWPNGRTNYYWFDLNRDWIPTVHPESRGRIQKFYEWMPNILTDHHEMGSNSTFFFQPGIPSRNNPYTPAANYALAGKMAVYHGEALDDIGSLYYSKESFDDFYYGKGSTYPDAMGTVGILFEQASARGHVQNSQHGKVSLAFAAHNQLATSMSTLRSAVDLKSEFLKLQKDHFIGSRNLASRDPVKGYQLSFSDPFLMDHFSALMERHQIRVYSSKRNAMNVIIPTEQRQYRLLKSMFEQRTRFTDSLFYDVSTWNLAAAYNATLRSLNRGSLNRVQGARYEKRMKPGTIDVDDADNYVLISWAHFYAPKVLYQLQQAGIKVKAAMKPFSVQVDGKKLNFHAGDLLIPLGMQTGKRQKVIDVLNTHAKPNGIDALGMVNGATISGPYFGSGNFRFVPKMNPAIIGGSGTSAYTVGEIWHLFDHVYGIPLTIIDNRYLNRVNLNKYTSVMVPGGNYNRMHPGVVKKLGAYAKSGGNLILMGGSVELIASQKWAKDFNLKDPFKVNVDTNTVRYPYDDASKISGAQVIGGAIFSAKLDLTHPIAFGYRSPDIRLFRRGSMVMIPTRSPYNSPVLYTSQPLFSGYVGRANLKRMANSAAVNVVFTGGGRITAIPDRPIFRGFFLGSSRLLINGVTFGKLVSKRD